MNDRPVIQIVPADLNIEQRIVHLYDKVKSLTATAAAAAQNSPASVKGQIVSSTSLNSQASLVGTGALPSFSYTSNTNSITWQWTNFSVPRPDGSNIPVVAGSQTFSGLNSATTYHFGIYATNSGSIVILMSDNGGVSKGSIPWQVQVVNGDGHNVITVDVTASTTASGNGGGSGSGNSCFSGNTRLKDGRRFYALPEVTTVETSAGPRQATLLTHKYEGLLLDMGNGELVTEGHLFRSGDKWVPAKDHFRNHGLVHFVGEVYNLEVHTESDEERNYVLANGETAHNYKLN